MVVFSSIIALGAIAFSAYRGYFVWKHSGGSGASRDVERVILQGVNVYARRQHTVMVWITSVVSLVFIWFLGFFMFFSFALGVIGSMSVMYVSMVIAVRSQRRTVEAIQTGGFSEGFAAASAGGASIGFFVGGVALLLLSILYGLYHDITILLAFAFGASLVSVFGRLGGGIYTKGADVGSDILQSIDESIPARSMKNPAIIADMVGDTVGDAAGMAGDLFQGISVAAIVTTIFGVLSFPDSSQIFFLPLPMLALILGASAIGTFFIRVRKNNLRPIRAFLYGIGGSILFSLAGLSLFLPFFFGEAIGRAAYHASLFGLLTAFALAGIGTYYSSRRFAPVRSLAQISTVGPAANIITGLSISLESVSIPFLVIGAGIAAGYAVSGFFGVAAMLCAMTALSASFGSINAFGPITDATAGVAELSGMAEQPMRSAHMLNEAGSVAKSVGSIYEIGSAAVAGIALIGAYVANIRFFGVSASFDLANPYDMIGVFAGVITVYIFSAMALRAVGYASKTVVEDVRRQFRDIKGIREGLEPPEYTRTIDALTRAALRAMIVPALFPVVLALILFWGFPGHAAELIGGWVLGTVFTGVALGISMIIGGSVWTSAKKLIEEGRFGGRGSRAHAASLIGDVVGDPYKDTAGPALSALVKSVGVIALLLARFL